MKTITMTHNTIITLKSLLSLFLIFTVACTEEFNISDFEENYKAYNSEMRIEAVLDQSDFSKSIIRIDKTILVTDTLLFNGIDDNNDWVSYTDENNNGQWDEGEPLNDDIGTGEETFEGDIIGRGNGTPDTGEPHVDDYAETLPQIHDSSIVQISLREMETGELASDFVWSSEVATINKFYSTDELFDPTSEDPYVSYSYGGYVPAAEYQSMILNPNLIYRIEILTGQGRNLYASTALIGPPKNVTWEGTSRDEDTLICPANNYELITWSNPPESNYCSFIVENYISPDSLVNLYSILLRARDTEDVNGSQIPIFLTEFVGFQPGLYKITLESYSDQYGKYVYSTIPPNDPEIASWRDNSGNVIIGSIGAKSSTQFYIRLTSG